MKIASWNVNSVNARLPTVLEVLKNLELDVVCFQEIKCIDDNFPRLEIEDMGYNIITHGQKSYNGVAILSKHPIEDVQIGLPGDDEDDQARYIEALIMGETPVRVASIYLPNGNPFPGPKFDYKLAWMDRLNARAKELLSYEEAVVLAGDYNCIPRDEDCYDPAAWVDDALAQPETRGKFRELQWMGYTEGFAARDNRGHQYTFWDYQAGAWQKDNGIRIDHLLCSPQAADKLKSVSIYKDARGMTKPSDHVPIIGEFEL
ncbi:exodeoxyribonuclease III [Hirschia baltica]|uniref:Exodeoxyribonuclease III Xth n=1 Tax=Hirschia baltica (strain ATCC 49814 / DSM 5838 / IFAM 1418) TaxID=582402 RepID=C6XIT2_HIRBI|nr:exodeoxyribonuclease III [Hirschia baltica]ACT59027.1 exodeoxyribonuclease III Xth [Hirschia baltica ATCC 49814]